MLLLLASSALMSAHHWGIPCLFFIFFIVLTHHRTLARLKRFDEQRTLVYLIFGLGQRGLLFLDHAIGVL
jgi:hypothetical protein